MPPFEEAGDAYGQPCGLSDCLRELPYVPCVDDGEVLAYRGDDELLYVPPFEEACNPHGQHAEVPGDLRTVPQVPGLEAKHLGPHHDHDLLDLPSLAAPDDPYGEPGGVSHGL